MKRVVLLKEDHYEIVRYLPLEDNRSITELLAEFIEKYK